MVLINDDDEEDTYNLRPYLHCQSLVLQYRSGHLSRYLACWQLSSHESCKHNCQEKTIVVLYFHQPEAFFSVRMILHLRTEEMRHELLYRRKRSMIDLLIKNSSQYFNRKCLNFKTCYLISNCFKSQNTRTC